MSLHTETPTELPDVVVHDNGSIISFMPISRTAKDWIDENIQSEGWQWFGGGLCVDRSYASDIFHALKNEGFILEPPR